MIHAPLTISTTAKLDISLLLKCSPSPPPLSRALQGAPRSRSPLDITPSIPPAQPSSSHRRTSTSSNISPPSSNAASSTHSQSYSQPQRPQLPPLASSTSHLNPQVPPPQQQQPTSLSHPSGKRPPPTPSHPSASPAKKQSKWTQDEDEIIIALRGSGMKWDDISKRLPGRSAISCRLHYQNYLERRSEWDEDKKNRLARLYERLKPTIWADLAAELNVPWRAAEAMHWQLGEADMARRAGVTPFSLATGPPTGAGPGHRPGSRLAGSIVSGYQVGGSIGVSPTNVQHEDGRNQVRALPGVAELEGGRRPAYNTDVRETRGPFSGYGEDTMRRRDTRRRGD